MLFIDLDELKPINDTRCPTIIAREDEAEEVAERLLEELSRTHRVEGHDLHVSASIGIATLEEGGIDHAEKLIQQADMDMYQAKQQGRNAYQRFSPDLDGKLDERVSVRSELQDALEREQLQLFYQPLVDGQGSVEGAEALIRWHHPEMGWMAPAQFIPLAEETGQIVELSRWVMRRAFQDTRRLVARGLLRGRVAINLSPLQFHRPNFLTQLRRMLEETGLSAQHVELELTEGTLMRDKEGAIDILNALTGMGISTAIDDFGTGYSSLAYLRTLPIDKIKIDRSFTLNVAGDDKDAAVCKGVITLARELELKVLAEGVETPAQYEYLLGLGCEAFQGYHFARPMPFDALVSHLEHERVASP